MNLNRLNLEEICKRAEGAFKACIESEDNSFLGKEIEYPIEDVVARREWIKIQVEEDTGQFVLEVRLILLSRQNSKVGYYCYHEDGNGLFVDDFLVFEQLEFYATTCGMLGSEEFVDSMIHRIGEHDVYAAARRRNELKAARDCDTRRLLGIVAKTFDIPKEDLCSRGKSSGLVDAKEVLILSGRRLGASLAEMSDLIGLNPSTTSRRHDTAKRRLPKDRHISEAVENVIKQYEAYRA